MSRMLQENIICLRDVLRIIFHSGQQSVEVTELPDSEVALSVESGISRLGNTNEFNSSRSFEYNETE